MPEFWAAEMARRTARRSVAAAALAAAAVLLVFVGQSRLIRNVFKGPFPVSPAELADIRWPGDAARYFVEVAGSDSFDTDIVRWAIEKKDGAEVRRTVTAEYFALVAGDRYLVVETDKLRSAHPLTVEGTLAPFPVELRSELEKKFGRPDLSRRFYPFYLKVGSIKGQAYGIVLVALIAGLAIFAAARPGAKVLAAPDEAPVMKKMRRWGEPFQISMAVERELSTAVDMKMGRWRITRSFLVRTEPFAFDLFRFDDLLWAYGSITRHSIYFIPTGSTFRARLRFDDGAAVIRGRREAVESLLTLAAERAPWAVHGFSEEVLERLRRDPGAFREQIARAKRDR